MAAATAWVRSLSCKYSTAVADDAYSPLLPPPKKHPPAPTVKGAASVALRPPERGRESRRSRSMSCERDRPAAATARKTKKKKEADATSELARKEKPRQRQAQLAASLERPSSALLEMTELPEGHPSRRVVELIFASGWARAADGAAEVDALFRVHGTARAAARFEAARAAARARGEAAGEARCAADGNEVMRFQCRPAAEAGGGSEVICAAVATCHKAGAARAVRTFSGSGAADAGAGGEGREGRRGMLVCRVIAGRVRRASADEHPGEYDSVEAEDGELVVLDRRAVLPCFLVVYTVKPPPELSTSSSGRSR
ncbi:hypothetical protein CFC21_059662 [Triticum aestivum]|uniref:PARP catalytic domain-containing protein n=2 Tax=Triticum aestivum TaxID=4565 RepID=A0A3B6IWB3_WHEAT|nr:uncharacterized protein LOC119294276 [Triticum dicoccoides]XP_044367227.1 uncharacterized protein LOC123089674 [Triticum aestivum]KAF7051425.1 hypothetical protein CFC21_059662 [Triticum aestivum]